jgi:hypothetical protein
MPPAYQPVDPVTAQANAQAQAQGSVDGATLQRLEKARAAAKASPGGSNEAFAFAREVENAYSLGLVTRGKASGPELVTEAVGYLDAAVAAHKDEGPKMLAAKGSLLLTSGDKPGAKKALEASFATPNLWPVAKLLALYESDGDKGGITSVCTKARAVAKSDDERMAVLDHCLEASHAQTPEQGLAWAPKGDIVSYKQHRAAEDAQAERDREAARQKSEADRQALQASFTKPGANDQGNHGGGSGGSAGSSGGAPVSVTIRSSCSSTVRVFYGSKPKYGSGTTSSISSNSVNSHTFQPGDMMWTVDDSDNGLGSVTISGSVHEIQIGSDCRSISAH